MGQPAAIAALIAGVLLLSAVATPGAAQDRHALVFGNNRYSTNGTIDLRTAVSDADRYVSFLRKNDWRVSNMYRHANRTGAAIYTELDKISARPGDDLLFIFSGHGWSDDKEFYLVPALPEHAREEDAYDSPSKLKQVSIPLSRVVGELDEYEPKRIIVIVDACSDRSFQKMAGDRVPQLDLSDYSQREILVLYSSQPGSVAFDSLQAWDAADAEPNSVFTRYFVPWLEKSSTLLEAFVRTRIQVERMTAGLNTQNLPRQIPAVIFDTIDGSVSLSKPEPVSPVREAIPTPEPAVVQVMERWRSDAEVCATDDDAVREALSERQGQDWDDAKTSAAARACISTAARARMGVEDLRFNVSNNQMVTFTDTTGDSEIAPGDALERLLIRPRKGGRPDVKAQPNLRVFTETLEDYAFHSDYAIGMMIKPEDQGGSRPVVLRLDPL